MDAEALYSELKEIALSDFSEIVSDCFISHGPLNSPRCLRIIFVDNSFAEIRISKGKYSFHYERRFLDGSLFRFDNAPHHENIVTHPHHVHLGKEDTIKESQFSGKTSQQRFREFVVFIRETMKKL